MAKLTINTFLSPKVMLDGNSISFPFKRVDALLYYMVCNKTATRREIVNILWENSEDETGYKNLRHTLYTLKKSLGVEVILSPQKAILNLNPEIEIECDYDSFCSKGDFSAYTGAFLQGFSVKNAEAFDDWVMQTRDFLQIKYLRGLYEKAAESLEKGDISKAEQYAMDYIRHDPLDEQIAVFLMRLYYEEKLYHKAIKVYQNFHAQIEQELGISPLNETTALYYEIMNKWNDTTAQADLPGQGGLPETQERLVSRMLAKFRDFNLSSNKQASFILWGEKGMGKTFLMSNLLSGINDPGSQIFSATCYQATSIVPLSPWNTIMTAVAEFLLEQDIAMPTPVCEILSEVFPVFCQEPTREENYTPKKLSLIHIDNIIMMFSILARRKKIVISIENIQDIDLDSMEIIDAMLRRLNNNQVMFMLTSRTITAKAIVQIVNSLIEDKLISRLDIEGLSPQDTLEFLQRQIEEPVTQEIADKIHKETGGNPLLLTEMLGNIRHVEDLESISLDFSTIFSQRMAGISTQAAQLADIISLFPDAAPCELLSAITDRSSGELFNIYEEMKERNIVDELYIEKESVLVFSNPHMRDYLYEAQSFFKRKSLHLRIARILEREYNDNDGRLCQRLIYHFTQGGDEVSSIKYKIIGLEMYSSCMQQYPSVLREYSDMPIPKPLDMESYLTALTEQLADCRSKSDNLILMDHLEGMLLTIKGRWGIFSGNYNIALDAIGKILSDPIFQANTNFTLSAYAMLTLYNARLNDMEQMERKISVGLNLAESVSNMAEIARFMLLRGYYFLRLGEFDRSAYYVTEAMERFIRLKNSRQYRMFIMSAYHYLGEIKRKQKDFAGACNEYKMGISVLAGVSNIPGIAAMYTDYGRAAFALDDQLRAKEVFAIACKNYTATGELFGKAMALAYSAYYLAMDGKFEECIAQLKQANDCANLGGIVQDNGVYWCIMAQLRQKLDSKEIVSKELNLYLQKPLTIYCKRGIKLLSEDQYSYEIDILKECLYYGMNKERPYTAEELYSKNKRFMTE